MNTKNNSPINTIGDLLDFLKNQKNDQFKESTDISTKLPLRVKKRFYIGIDPTSDHLHFGHLSQLSLVLKLINVGFKPVILFGGFTGLVGDPTGRTEKRKNITSKEVEENIVNLKFLIKNFFLLDNKDYNLVDIKEIDQLEKISEDNTNADVLFINNNIWWSERKLSDFLTNEGRFFNISSFSNTNHINDKNSESISITKALYPLLQGYDFYFLNKKLDCQFQIGGSDQWINIVAGLRNINEFNNKEKDNFGVTTKLLTDSKGKKLGKSSENTNKISIWPNNSTNLNFLIENYKKIIRYDDAEVESIFNTLNEHKFFKNKYAVIIENILDELELKDITNFYSSRLKLYIFLIFLSTEYRELKIMPIETINANIKFVIINFFLQVYANNSFLKLSKECSDANSKCDYQKLNRNFLEIFNFLNKKSKLDSNFALNTFSVNNKISIKFEDFKNCFGYHSFNNYLFLKDYKAKIKNNNKLSIKLYYLSKQEKILSYKFFVKHNEKENVFNLLKDSNDKQINLVNPDFLSKILIENNKAFIVFSWNNNLKTTFYRIIKFK